jgi:hypothetical protein
MLRGQDETAFAPAQGDILKLVGGEWDVDRPQDFFAFTRSGDVGDTLGT